MLNILVIIWILIGFFVSLQDLYKNYFKPKVNYSVRVADVIAFIITCLGGPLIPLYEFVVNNYNIDKILFKVTWKK